MSPGELGWWGVAIAVLGGAIRVSTPYLFVSLAETLTEKSGSLEVEVRDNGRGISPEDQVEIFGKFHQVGNKLTDKPHGSGLGLHISRQIIEHFGGRLWVDSDVGCGASFSFSVPISASSRALAA